MVQYRYGRGADDTIADAQDLAGTNCEGKQFYCLGCEERLIAKVNGEKVRPHFAHHPGALCSPETYLHRLGKQVFAEVYSHCLKSGEPFEIELWHPLICRRFESTLGSVCNLKRVQKKTYDLTAYFDTVAIERQDGAFVPDLLLTSSKNEKRRIYVEIAVTHCLSDRKETSGERIIEIPVESEADLDRIKSRKLTPDDARFVNFTTESQHLTDSDCRCHNRTAYAFFVYESGKSVLEKSAVVALAAKRHNQGDAVKYFRLVYCSEDADDGFHPSLGNAFRDAVVKAREEGFPLRNCYLCRYQGDNFARGSDSPIYCKLLKKRCSSNEAVSCHAFRTDVITKNGGMSRATRQE